MIFLVALSSVILAVQVEVPAEEWQFHLMMDRVDQFILLSFMVEILLVRTSERSSSMLLLIKAP